MIGFKPFKTVLRGGSQLKDVADKAKTLAVVLTNKELESNPPEFYKKAMENDSFKEDLKRDKSAWIYHDNKRILLATHETKEDDTPAKTNKAARSLGVKIMQGMKAKKVKNAGFYLTNAFSHENVNHFINSSILMNYQYSLKEDVFDKETTEDEKAEKSQKPVLLESLDFFKEQAVTQAEQSETDFVITSSNCTLFGRDIINTRGSVAHPEFMEERIRELAEGKHGIVELHVVKGKELETQGLNLFYNVGKGASKEPRLITVHYRGNPSSNTNDFAIIGKGLTFDSGGLNLKPTGFIEDMFCDKGGTVATMGALKGVIELKLPINVAFAFGIAENAIDAKSYKPGDVIKSLKGITVEIGNTDAEGRLVLADTMTFTQKRYKPKFMVDLATLTGACMVALGHNTSGLFTNDDAFLNTVKNAGDSVFEDFWQLPIKEEHRETIKGETGNISNSGKDRYGGASSAAAFLENFVEKDTKWVHWDIAGPAYLKKPNFPMPSQGTGFGIQTLLKMMRDYKA